MSAPHAYDWLLANKNLVAHLPLNDDVSAMVLGGTKSLADTEGLLTTTLTNSGTAATLPTNVAGPLPGTTAIQCPNNERSDVLAYNYALASLADIVPANTDWTVGFWMNAENAANGGTNIQSWVWHLMQTATATSGLKTIVWNHPTAGSRTRMFFRESAGAGTNHTVNYGGSVSAGTWAFVAVSYHYAGVASTVAVTVNGAAVGSATLVGTAFGGWASDALWLWASNAASPASAAEFGWRGALWDWSLCHASISTAEAAKVYKLYNTTVGTISTTTPATATTVGLTVTAATNSAGGFTNQWHRSTDIGFAPDGTTELAGATSLTLNDSGLARGTTYYYRVVQTDADGDAITTDEHAVTTPRGPGSTSAYMGAFGFGFGF